MSGAEPRVDAEYLRGVNQTFNLVLETLDGDELGGDLEKIHRRIADYAINALKLLEGLAQEDDAELKRLLSREPET